MPLSRFQPDQYAELLHNKATRVASLFAAFDAPPPLVVPSQPEGFRMRAEFRMWHDGDGLDYVMFNPAKPKVPVAIDVLPIAAPRIQQLMPILRDRLRVEPELRRKLFQVEFLTTLSGEALVTLAYHRPLQADWEALAALLARDLDIGIIGRSRKQKLVLTSEFVTETLSIQGRDYHYRQYEQAFTQPNALVNMEMINWAMRLSEGLRGDLLELYCGNGNFSLPLASRFDQVIATELAKVSVRAARHNIQANNIRNLNILRLSAEETSQAMAGERVFRRLGELPKPLSAYTLNTVLVDPPRAGLDLHTEDMVCGFDTIVYISCNPQTLAANLGRISRSHRIEQFALFDQFPYTDHMECGMLLQRR